MPRFTQRFSKRFEEYPPPDGKAGEMECGCAQGVDERECMYYHRLQFDLANSYYWSGVCIRDYIFFVKNWHPFLGMFFCHPNHPWTKFERLLMFFVSLSITMVPSAAIAADADPDYCTLLTILFVTIPDTISGILLYQLSIAETRGRCHMFADCIKLCTGFAIVYVLAMGLGSTFACFVILRHTTGRWFKLLCPLIKGKMISYLTWFPMMLLMPCQIGFFSLWCAERAEARKAEGNEQGHSSSDEDGGGRCAVQ